MLNTVMVYFVTSVLEPFVIGASAGLLMRLEFKKGHARFVEMSGLLIYWQICVSEPCQNCRLL